MLCAHLIFMNPRVIAPPRTKFTAVEDALIIDIARKMTEIDWKTVAEILGTRTPRQCRERYHNYLAPNVSNKNWTPEDDKLLEEQYLIFGPQWAKIRARFPGRSCVNIKNRWAKMMASKQRRSQGKKQSESKPKQQVYVVPMLAVEPRSEPVMDAIEPDLKPDVMIPQDDEAVMGHLSLLSNDDLLLDWNLDGFNFFDAQSSCF